MLFLERATADVLGFVTARWLLFGVTPHDPETLVGSAALFTLVASVAGGVPACRASRIDPAVMLHEG
jgi:ABC-type antimicrobial peptide transport system permease subunit